MIDVFSYSDYREFISDYLYAKKKEDKRNTHRHLAKLADFPSSSFFALVISGKRNLVRNSLAKMIKFLDLRKREELYFIAMVEYQQEKDPATKIELFKELTKRRQGSSYYKLHKDQFEYFSKWYIPVIKEVVTFANVGKDLEKIIACFKTKITKKEAKEAIAILLKLEIIEEGDESYKLHKPLISAANVPFEILKHIKKEYIYKSIEAMNEFPVEERYITSSTVSISEESYSTICDEIDTLRRKIMGIAEADKSVDRVVQFNFQGFLLTDVFKSNEVEK